MNKVSWKSRTELLIGKDKSEALQKAHVLVAGLGGVGGYAAELLCRAGIGKLTLVDNDIVQDSNRNRQLAALCSTEGKLKVEVIAERLKDINPEIQIVKYSVFLSEENLAEIIGQPYDFIIDAIDTLTPKVLLLKEAVSRGRKAVSSMGSGGKINPEIICVDSKLNVAYGTYTTNT